MTKNTSPAVRADAFENAITGLGTTRDKRTHASVGTAAVLDRDTLDELYAGSDVAARVVELPAAEMTRRWIEVRTEDEEAGKAMLQRLDDLDAQSKTQEALTWARLYGGALLLVGADDGLDPREPLEAERVKTLEWLTVLSRHEVTVHEKYADPLAANYGEPKLYRITRSGGLVDARGQAFGELVHESRVIRFDGPLTPRRRKERNGGWCDSVLERMYETIRDYGQSWGGVAHLMTDLSQGVLRMHRLADMLAADGTGTEVVQRLQLLDLARSVSRLLPLDAEHESFERMATPLGGVPEILDRLAQRLSQATGIPVTLLMGQAPAGLNATGESDIRFFYDRVEADQERVLKPRLGRLLELLWRAKDGPTSGREPPEWSLEFRPLWQLSEKEIAEIRKLDAERAALLIQWDVVHPDEVASSFYGGDRYSGEIQLDEDARRRPEPGAPDPATEEPGTVAPADPGAPPTARSEPGVPVDQKAKDPKQALNGQQVSSLVEVSKLVAAGELSREAGLGIILASFPLTEAEAKRILGPEDFEPKKPEPPAMVPGQPPAPPKAPGAPPTPPEDDGDEE